MNKFLFLLFLVSPLFSQTLLKGKVIAETNPDGILVVNATTKTSTITENGGFFSIEVQNKDKLIITSDKIDGVAITVDANVLQKEILYVSVKARGTQLEEIQIKGITAKSLGIVNHKIKEYTPAERKLRTAEKLKWYSPLLIPLGGMSVDGLINQISGRTSMLKKELHIERKEKKLEKLDAMFEDTFYEQNLHIPKENIKGFKLYCLDYPELMQAVQENNRFLAVFLIGEVATQYKSLILSENKH